MHIEPVTTMLGLDPPTKNRLNACSYQQSALVTYLDYQYAVFYMPATTSKSPTTDTPRYVCLSRRRAPPKVSTWETLVFDDYAQTTDDGHNTISLGISSDGTIHLAFDHHCNQLHMRTSILGLARDHSKWSTSLFSDTLNALPGISKTLLFTEVSYPRFVNTSEHMLLEYRIGKAGEGSCVLFRFASNSGDWSYLGTYLTGVASNPYPNGLSYASGRLHVSWTYRHFIDYEGAKDPGSTAHQAQAGPNGPENNADLCYAYSQDDGQTWSNSHGELIADLGKGQTILPTSRGITAYEIPRGSGVLNQESQAAHPNGNFHVLNRQKDEQDQERWHHYWRDSKNEWHKKVIVFARTLSGTPTALRPTESGPRGSIATDHQGDVYYVIRGNNDDSLKLIRSSAASFFENVELLWEGYGFDAEPLIDDSSFQSSNVLSVFIVRDGLAVVLDFTVSRDFDNTAMVIEDSYSSVSEYSHP